jgi:hypothetical protein
VTAVAIRDLGLRHAEDKQILNPLGKSKLSL